MNEDRNLRISRPGEVAGGLSAVTSALKMSFSQMGMLRAASTLLKVNQKDGFDCPGCAWPDPDDRRSMVEFCENGAKAVAEEATRKRVTPKFFKEWSLLALAEQSDYWLGGRGRLTHPMYLPSGTQHYQPISWENAFALIAKELKGLASPNEAIFYTSGRTSNEAAFLYQLFVRQFGTNNLPDCSNMCHESSGVALSRTIGSGKGSVTLEDFDHADCILVIGQNPGTNHPRMLATLQTAARRGCKIISINPLAETGLKRFSHPQEVMGLLGKSTELATHHLPVRINGDVALLKGLHKSLMEKPNFANLAFIQKHTEGFEAFRDNILMESWEKIVEQSGIEEEKIREVAQVLADSKALICCWAMGLTQHLNAVANIEEIVNLLLLGGHFGRPGAGACPVRGHSNVQGDRTMGIWEKPSPAFLAALGKEFQFTPPSAHGYDTVEAIQAMHGGKAKVFFAMGGNFISACPDTEFTAQALKQCRLTVHVSTKLNRSHVVTGKEALILPCLGRTERDIQARGPQFVSVENSMGVVHSSQGRLEPASEFLKSEPAIVAGLAKAVLGQDWDFLIEDYDRIRGRIANVVPGFENFPERIQRAGGFALPHPVRDRLEFLTDTGKAKFTVHPIPEWKLEPDNFLMMTLRTHDQYNTTIYGLDDRYRGILKGRRVVLVNPQDIRDRGFSDAQIVNLVSHFEGEIRRAERFQIVSYEIPRGCIATYFPETNVLVPVRSYAEGSQTPTSKSIVVSFEALG